jgi:hypothetical protein
MDSNFATKPLEQPGDGLNKSEVLNKDIKPNTCFISGALAINDNGTERPADDAEIRLFKDGKLIMMAATNFSGEFKLDRLPKNSGKYELEYVVDDFDNVRQEAFVEEDSLCLDVVVFG